MGYSESDAIAHGYFIVFRDPNYGVLIVEHDNRAICQHRSNPIAIGHSDIVLASGERGAECASQRKARSVGCRIHHLNRQRSAHSDEITGARLAQCDYFFGLDALVGG